MLTLDKIREIDAWLDEAVAERYGRQPLAQDWARISKVAEELGEVVDAFIGCTGQNPRKGEYGDMSDVLEELADVAFTAILAMQHFTKDANHTFMILGEKLNRIHARITERKEAA